MTYRLVAAAVLLAAACKGHGSKQPMIHRDLHTKGTSVTALPSPESGLAMRDARPKLEITGAAGPIIDALKSRIENDELVKKGAVMIDVRLDPETPPPSGKLSVTMHIQGVFSRPPNITKVEAKSKGDITYGNVTEAQLGSELGAEVLGYFAGEKIPLGEVQPPSTTMPKVTRLAAGPPDCSLHEDGSVRCWEEKLRAVPIPHASDSIAIDGGDNFGACGVHKDGRVWCLDAWDNTVAMEVRNVCGVEHAKDISVGQQTACALLEDGHVRCWPRSTDAFEPCSSGHPAVEIAGITDAASLSVGPFGGCVVRKGGTVECWEHCGKTCKSGVVGMIDVAVAPKAEAVKGLAAVKAVVDHFQPCALVGDDHVKCVARGDLAASDFKVPEPVTKIGAGKGLCALTTKGNLYCWLATTPMLVDGVGDLVDFATDIGGTCGLKRTGEVLCWDVLAGPSKPTPVSLGD